MYFREKKSSYTRQNSDTGFPNQETLTKHPFNPPTERKLHSKDNSTNFQNMERPPQTQQYKQNEKAEKYSTGKGTG